jgi:diguanylate cyclase (GGDEF)-like protein
VTYVVDEPNRNAGPPGAVQQASLLFLVAGIVTLITNHLPYADYEVANDIVGLAALASVPLGWLLPWSRWSERWSLVYVPFCLTLLVVTSMFGAVQAEIYGVWFVVCFVWIGVHHPPRTPLVFGLPAAIAYVIPLATAEDPSAEAIRSVGIAVPAAVLIGELLARTTTALRAAQVAQEQATALLAVAAVTDDLTGLGNRRRANTILDRVTPGDALLLLDLDHFKDINDRLGHAAGDHLLTRFGEFLAANVRDHGDAVARYGGEEFLVVAHNAGEREAQRTAERLLAAWREANPPVSFSIGIAVNGANQSPRETLARADSALYRAKAAGRDCAVR